MAEYYLGKNAYFLMSDEETAYGTAEAANKDIGLVQNVTLNLNRNATRMHTLGDVEVHAIASGKADITGNVTFLWQHGRILRYIFGAEGAVSGTTDKKHLWNDYTTYFLDTVESVSVETGVNGTADLEWKLDGVKFNNLTCSLAVDGTLTASTDWSAQDIVTDTSSTAAVIDASLIPLKDFQCDVTYGTVGSEAALPGVQSFDVTFNNVAGGEPRLWHLGSVLTQDAQMSQRQVEGRITLALNSSTLLNDLTGASAGFVDTGTEVTDKGLVITAHNNVAADSGREEFMVDLSGVRLATVGTPLAVGGYIIQDVAFWAKTIDQVYVYDDIADYG